MCKHGQQSKNQVVGSGEGRWGQENKRHSRKRNRDGKRITAPVAKQIQNTPQAYILLPCKYLYYPVFLAALHFLPHIRWELKTLPLSKCLGLVSVIPSPYLNVSWIFQNMLTMLEWSAFQFLLLKSDCLYGYVNLFPLPALTFFLLCTLYGGS